MLSPQDYWRAIALERVEREGFTDVVPRFHTVTRDPIPLRFYEATPKGLVLSDALLATTQGSAQEMLRVKTASRWDLLEAAFAMRLLVKVLGTDEHMLYRITGCERIDITRTHPVLDGYHNGLCFSCREAQKKRRAPMDGSSAERSGGIFAHYEVSTGRFH